MMLIEGVLYISREIFSTHFFFVPKCLFDLAFQLCLLWRSKVSAWSLLEAEGFSCMKQENERNFFLHHQRESLLNIFVQMNFGVFSSERCKMSSFDSSSTMHHLQSCFRSHTRQKTKHLLSLLLISFLLSEIFCNFKNRDRSLSWFLMTTFGCKVSAGWNGLTYRAVAYIAHVRCIPQ